MQWFYTILNKYLSILPKLRWVDAWKVVINYESTKYLGSISEFNQIKLLTLFDKSMTQWVGCDKVNLQGKIQNFEIGR